MKKGRKYYWSGGPDFSLPKLDPRVQKRPRRVETWDNGLSGT